MTKRYLTLAECEEAAKALLGRVHAQFAGNAVHGDTVFLRAYGIPRGGIPAVYIAKANLGGYVYLDVVQDPALADIYVDDIYDSGATAARYTDKPFYVLFDKRDSRWAGQWLVMPWEATAERDDSATDIVTRLLQVIGEDATREGLRDTPARFLKAWEEWTAGYKVDPVSVLKTFEDGATGVDEMVIVHGIPVVSKCEHHLADIVGTAHVAYIPNNKIVGLSKLPRLVDVFARRLQVQERLTNQIADTLEQHLAPKGVAVLINAGHGCMSTRGVKIHGSTTTTSALRGVMKEGTPRAEFLQLCAMAK